MEKFAFFIEKSEKKNANKIARNNGTPTMIQENEIWTTGKRQKQTAIGWSGIYMYGKELYTYDWLSGRMQRFIAFLVIKSKA